MSFNLDDFIAKPTVAKLNACTKDDLLEVAGHYGVKKSLKKQQQRWANWGSFVKEVFEPAARDLPGKEESTGEPDFSNQLALGKLELEFEYKKLEREFELKAREAEPAEQAHAREAERAEQAHAREREHELEIRRIGGVCAQSNVKLGLMSPRVPCIQKKQFTNLCGIRSWEGVVIWPLVCGRESGQWGKDARPHSSGGI